MTLTRYYGFEYHQTQKIFPLSKVIRPICTELFWDLNTKKERTGMDKQLYSMYQQAQLLTVILGMRGEPATSLLSESLAALASPA